jgi:hypothetical protein
MEHVAIAALVGNLTDPVHAASRDEDALRGNVDSIFYAFILWYRVKKNRQPR